jgi:hypothetical protein
MLKCLNGRKTLELLGSAAQDEVGKPRKPPGRHFREARLNGAAGVCGGRGTYGFSMVFWYLRTIFGWEFGRGGCAERSTEMIVHRTRSTKQGRSGYVSGYGLSLTARVRAASAAPAALLCAGRAQQLGGASPPANLMEVKA